jgi:hypothetical protein
MATTTPNFGWPVPTSTDLVKDGATAIEALGDAIDASLVDLEGGTTGQILAKASNTDMDFAWITNDVGDITAVTAGTGISGGGTSGAVTITNSMATAIDAKGDLVAGTGADAFARLAVGTDGHGLTAASGETTGLKWAPTFGSTIAIQRGTSNQTITANTWTKIQLNQEDLDTDGSYDPTTNFRFTPKVAGYYQFNTLIYMAQQTGTNFNNFAIYKNGSFHALVDLAYITGPKGRPTIISANGTTDYFEWYMYAATTDGLVENRSGGSPTTVTWLRGL